MAIASSARTQKKTIRTSSPQTNEGIQRDIEQALLALESACMHIFDSRFVHDREDEDGILWQRTFKNIVTPISLSLREYKGPRRFHYHYKHSEEDDSVLTPVMEDPLDTLAQVCQSALAECTAHLVGIGDPEIAANRDMLEQALRKFLSRYKKFKQ